MTILVIVFAALTVSAFTATWRRIMHNALEVTPLQLFAMQMACGVSAGCLFSFAVVAVTS